MMIIGIVLTVALNSVAAYWEKPLSDYFGVIGEGSTGDTSNYLFPSEFASEEERKTAQADLTEQIVAEGTVLLKNNGALPFTDAKKISLFGISSAGKIVSGSGSGAVSGEVKSLKESLIASGYEINETLYDFYANSTHSHGSGAAPGGGSAKGDWKIDEVPQSEYASEVFNSYASYNDAAIVVFSRKGGEGGDLPTEMSRFGGNAEDNYLSLSQEEKDLLRSIKDSGTFAKTLVIINSAGAMELGFVDQDEYGVDAALWYTGTGSNGIDAIGKVINGEINPSGKLIDTYVYDNKSSAAMQNFGDYRYVDANGELTGQSYVNYGEGVYVGYRYYETRYEDQVIGTDGVGDYDYKSTVKYPFGHGISYTEFTWGEQKLVEENGSYTMSVEVTNSGTVAGKDVIQLYAQTPYTIGGIEKSSVQLVGYTKTKELQPNEKEVIEIKFDQKDLASYDYIGEKTYVLDSGSYYITAAKNAHDAVNNVLSAKGFSTANGMDYDGNSSLVSQFDVAEKVLFNTSVTNSEITNQFDDVIAEDALYLSRSNWSVLDNGQLEYASSSISGVSEVTDLEGDVATLTISEALRDALSAEGYDASGAPAIDSVGYPNKDSYKYDEKTNLVLSDMVGLPFDDPKWDELLNAMKLSEQHGLFNKSGYGTAAIDSVGKPKTFEYDGPSGISNFITGESGFGFPTSTMVAATFNTDLAAEFGKLVGEDAINTKTSGWYAPAVNIHRTPFSGRNYEYYSEDPYLSGNVSLNVVKAVQDKGVYVYVKHFALNDQETNRAAYNSVATWSNEQAIREIYLKPFQMSIETGGAKGLMMSLNRIGSTHATTNYNLITNVTRGEWGFQGVIITDYMSGMSPEFADQFLAAGGDMFLATGAIPLSDAKQDWSRAELRRSSKNVLFNIANSLAMNGLTDGGTFSNGIAVYQIVLWIVDALVAFGLFISGKKVYTAYKQTEEDFQADRDKTKKRRRVFWLIVLGIVIVIVIVLFVVFFPLIKDAFLM